MEPLVWQACYWDFWLNSCSKKQEGNSPLNVEITEAEHPQLFAFIRQLCADTKAPLPHKVYVNHEINACVFYDSTILSLFLPVKKNLLIGLGLVNTLNLSEFKAVLAHEFGHFAQSSMKLGSYVYMANNIIHSMVYDRDKWDELLDTWKRSNFQLAVFGWLLMPVVWLIRKFMAFIFQGINIVHASLSRQMEFNADRVAVSVSGSNAIIHALYRLNASSEAFDYSNSFISTAIDNKTYTTNLFYHHSKAMEYLVANQPGFKEVLLENKLVNLPEESFLFDNEDAHLSQMYASHPSNFHREQNAKAVHIAGVEDIRSAWTLFEAPDALAEQVTQNILRVNLHLHPNIKFTPAAQVQDFIEAEQAETTYKPHYLGVYDHRLISQLDVSNPQELVTASGLSPNQLHEAATTLYGHVLEEKMAARSRTFQDLQTLSLIIQKQDKRKQFELSNGFRYEAAEAQPLLEQRLQELAEDENWFKEFDTKVFVLHYLLAEDNAALKEDFQMRYTFLMAWVKILTQWQQEQQAVQETIQAVVKKGEQLSEKAAAVFAADFSRHRNTFDALLKETSLLSLPQMQNINASQQVAKMLLQEELVMVSMDKIVGNEIEVLVSQSDKVEQRMQRIYFKSLGSILNLQEQLLASVQEATLV